MPAVADRIESRQTELTVAERRVAEVILADPESVAFGTVAGLARRSNTSGATVVRMANRLGFNGYVGLQANVQAELARRLRPASERIRHPPAGDALATALATELDNVQATLEGVDRAEFAVAVGLLAGRRRRSGGRVLVLSGDASHGVALGLATELGMLRPDVELITGTEVRVARSLAHVQRGDVVVVVDVRRYDRWLLAASPRAVDAGADLIAITDGRLSPLAGLARASFVVSAVGAGPFDSQIGTMALANALVAGVAARLRATASARLDRVERAWTDAGALVDT